MMTNLELTISNPLNVLLKESGYMVLLPAINGEMGILHEHIPTIVSLDFGLIKLLDSHNKITSSFYIDGGVAQINRSSINVVCNYMKESAAIDKELLLEKIMPLSEAGGSKFEFYNKILKASEE